MSRSVMRFAIMAIAVAGLAVYAGWRTAPGGVTAADSPLEIEGLDFGEAWSQPAFPWKLILRNSSPSPLLIEHVETSCECTDVSPRSATIAAGESLSLHLMLKLARSEPDVGPREFAVDLTFRFKGESAQPAMATLRGKVLPSPIQADPERISLGEVVITDAVTYKHSVAIRFDHDPSTLKARTDASVRARIHLEEGDPMAFIRQLSIQVTPDILPGPFSFLVGLGALDADRHPGLALYLPVHGEVVDDVRAIPSSLMLGARPVGEEFQLDISFQSRTGREIRSFELLDAPPNWNLEFVDPGTPTSPIMSFHLVGRIDGRGAQQSALRVQFDVAELNRPVIAGAIIEYYGLIAE